MIDFDTWEALESYSEHAGHKALGRQLVDNAEGGVNGILVLDLDI